MRVCFFLACILFCTNGFAQSLKDSLFGGKLKPDSALIKKSGLDKAQKTPLDSSAKSINTATPKTGADSMQKQVTAPIPALTYQDNNKIWKKFVDQYTKVINEESLPSKKIRRGTYSVLVEYEIGADGVVTTTNITSTPSSDYLVQQVSEKMMANAPQLAPLIRDGKAVKSRKRQLLTFTKEKN